MTASLLKCFCVFGAILQGFCYDKLLVDQLRVDFLKLEDELWQYVLQDRSDSTVDPGIYVVKKFHEFDKDVQQVRRNIFHKHYYRVIIHTLHERILIYFSI